LKILLLGANGQVGTELRRSLVPLGEVVAATRNGQLADGTRCEIANFDAPESLPALVQRIAPDAVVNAAAYTAVDLADSEPEAAFRANAEAPAVLASACAAQDAWLIHYSTDYVFDGNADRPYREDDPTGPASVYGASKLAGEQAIRGSGARHLILRTAWVYAAHGKNFLLTMLRLARERESLRVVADQFGSPTPAPLIADVTARLLQAEGARSGTWHLTASGHISWHGFAQAIFDEAVRGSLLPRAPEVVPIRTADYPTPARRPAWSVLDNSALQRDFGLVLPSWQDALPEVLASVGQ
jgi:dTDP-4-dehydrorhamnose reductase